MSPHFVVATVALHVVLLAKSTKPKSNPAGDLIFFAVILGAVYLFFLRPNQARKRRVQQTQQAIEIGDEVMLTSGIIGRVRWLEADRARLEIAPGVEVEVLRAAIARQIPATVPEESEDGADSHSGDAPEVPSVDGGGWGEDWKVDGNKDGDVKEGT